MISPATAVSNPSSAVAQLRTCYETRGLSHRTHARPIAAITSRDVPRDILDAAGYDPLLLSPLPGPTPLADRYMEHVFPQPFRSLFDDLLAGRLPFISKLIIPRSSEHEHKLYLYLREMQRLEPERQIPEVILYNVLHTGTPEARAYSMARTRDLLCTLGGATGADLQAAIHRGNEARAAIRTLLRVRRDRIPGAEVLPLIGASFFMNCELYARLASEAVLELAQRPLTRLPRVLLKGVPLDRPNLHELIEQHALIVSAEDDVWGTRAAVPDIPNEPDALQAIFDHAQLTACNPRVFPADSWFQDALDDVDAVIFYLPPSDDVYGWDYPRQRKLLNDRGIPHMLIREDIFESPVPQKLHDRLEAFASSLRR